MNKPTFSNFLFRNRERFITWVIVLGFLATWEILARTGNVIIIIFPPPTTILSAFVTNIFQGQFFKDTLLTLMRVVSGFVIGGGIGFLLGMIMGWSKPIRKVLDPIIAAFHPIPKIALFPMVLILFGLGEASRNAMVAISAFFPMIINTMVGVMQINPTYYEVVENYGANKLDIFRKVVIPGSLPFVMSGIRLSFKSALTIAISVEVVFGTTGLGSKLWLAWETMRITNLYSVLIIIGIIGVGSNALIRLASKYLIPWHHEHVSS